MRGKNRHFDLRIRDKNQSTDLLTESELVRGLEPSKSIAARITTSGLELEADAARVSADHVGRHVTLVVPANHAPDVPAVLTVAHLMQTNTKQVDLCFWTRIHTHKSVKARSKPRNDPQMCVGNSFIFPEIWIA